MKYFITILLCGMWGCGGVQVYDPPMVANRVGQSCTRNQQCPFPTICSAVWKVPADVPGVCQ